MLSEATSWRRLYIAATLAGAGVGVLLVIGALPVIPQQLTTWMGTVNSKAVALLTPIAGGALIGFALAAVAHFGVSWQLSQRSKSGAG